ncbi:unnamed protein product [Prunus armeniaca]|uniref:Uncharacterized protein n=1 Tax=Prunus armeniaca TaxID=36596 RepID=A0A6J5UTC5_PRUAR|nr:hypothetical protein GBA52_016145 [Prunus armeniaca]CAB4279282.1 unnamed protein product [Prunus armeniaca]
MHAAQEEEKIESLRSSSVSHEGDDGGDGHGPAVVDAVSCPFRAQCGSIGDGFLWWVGILCSPKVAEPQLESPLGPALKVQPPPRIS